jgi:hypothetical protein
VIFDIWAKPGTAKAPRPIEPVRRKERRSILMVIAIPLQRVPLLR